MAQPETPFQEAIKVLASIIAEHHLRILSVNEDSIAPAPKPLPNDDVERDIDQMETHDG